MKDVTSIRSKPMRDFQDVSCHDEQSLEASSGGREHGLIIVVLDCAKVPYLFILMKFDNVDRGDAFNASLLAAIYNLDRRDFLRTESLDRICYLSAHGDRQAGSRAPMKKEATPTIGPYVR
jgi:hypothetical protein